MSEKEKGYSSYNLEEGIMDCWKIVDDINLLHDSLLDKDLTQDQISNILLGLSSLYELKFNKLFDKYKKDLKEKYENGQ